MLIPVDDLWPDNADPRKPRLICKEHDWFSSDEEQKPCVYCEVERLTEMEKYWRELHELKVTWLDEERLRCVDLRIEIDGLKQELVEMEKVLIQVVARAQEDSKP